MAPPRRSEDQLNYVKELIEGKLREGYRPTGMNGSGKAAILAAAVDAVKAGTFKDIANFKTFAYSLEGTVHEPDWSLYRPRQYLTRPPGLPVIPPQDHLAEDEPEGDPLHVAVIGDAHDSPHLRDKSRFRWLGAFIEEHGLQRVISTGDWWTMDCFSSHTERSTFEGLARPTFEQDRDSFHESQQAFQDGLAGHRPKKDITLGNHCNRAWKYSNLHPDGLHYGLLVDEAFAQWGWRTTPYGEYRFIAQVGFTHVPFNAMGRPMAQSQRPNKAMFDTIHGDDHRATQITDFKSGPVRSPTIYSAGTALPPGYIEGYANKGGSTWRSGICDPVLWGGYVRRWAFTEMSLLRARYGRSGEGGERTMKGWMREPA